MSPQKYHYDRCNQTQDRAPITHIFTVHTDHLQEEMLEPQPEQGRNKAEKQETLQHAYRQPHLSKRIHVT